MENYDRMVIDLYKRFFSEYKKGGYIDVSVLTEAQNSLNFAIDRAKVANLPFEELEALKIDLAYLKYDLLL